MWRSGGPTSPIQVATMYPVLYVRPFLNESFTELCSSTTVLNITGMGFRYNDTDMLPFLVATNGQVGYQTGIIRPPPYFDDTHMTLDLNGITDEHRGPLYLTVSLMSVVSSEKIVAVVHAGSQDIFWSSPTRSRFATTTASLVEFNATHLLTTKDQVALLWNQDSCQNASVTPYLSTGSTFRRYLSEDDTLLLPGSGIYGNELPLIEGHYLICVCDNEEGNTGCDDDNEYQKLAKKLIIITIPRLVQPPETRIRAITRSSPDFRMYPMEIELLRNGDFVFFTEAPNCSFIPLAHLPNQTSQLILHNTDSAGVSTFRLPSSNPLTALSPVTERTLTACFTTFESGNHQLA